MIKIDNCPFCGSSTADTGEVRWNPVRLRWAVVCGGDEGCWAQGPTCDTEPEAILAWNDRADVRIAAEGTVDVDHLVAPLRARAAHDRAFAALQSQAARVAGLETALTEIAHQLLEEDMDDDQIDSADWVGGYEECVRTARKALAL